MSPAISFCSLTCVFPPGHNFIERYHRATIWAPAVESHAHVGAAHLQRTELLAPEDPPSPHPLTSLGASRTVCSLLGILVHFVIPVVGHWRQGDQQFRLTSHLTYVVSSPSQPGIEETVLWELFPWEDVSKGLLAPHRTPTTNQTMVPSKSNLGNQWILGTPLQSRVRDCRGTRNHAVA